MNLHTERLKEDTTFSFIVNLTHTNKNKHLLYEYMFSYINYKGRKSRFCLILYEI